MWKGISVLLRSFSKAKIGLKEYPGGTSVKRACGTLLHEAKQTCCLY
jgi:hypothetical protein